MIMASCFGRLSKNLGYKVLLRFVTEKFKDFPHHGSVYRKTFVDMILRRIPKN